MKLFPAFINFMAWIFFAAVVMLSGCKPTPEPSPRPTPGPKPEYSAVKRIPHGTVADVWRLHLDSRLIGSCAVSYSDEVLIPLRVWSEKQGARIDWDFEKRAVSIEGERMPDPVFVILQTSYTTPMNLQAFSRLRHEVLAAERTVIVHTCGGEGWNKAGC